MLKIQVARPEIEPRTSCSASQELNHLTTAAPRKKSNTYVQSSLLLKILTIEFLSQNRKNLLKINVQAFSFSCNF